MDENGRKEIRKEGRVREGGRKNEVREGIGNEASDY